MKAITSRAAVLLLTLALVLSVGLGAIAQPVSHASAQDTRVSQPLVVLPSAARTSSGTSSALCGLGGYDRFAMALVVTAVSGTSPTLDVTWQHSIDGGTTWFTVVAFTQKTTAVNELRVESEVLAATAEVWGDCMRVSYTIGGTTPSFTFKVDLQASNG